MRFSAPRAGCDCQAPDGCQGRELPIAPNPYRLDEFAKPKPVGTERDEEDSPGEAAQRSSLAPRAAGNSNHRQTLQNAQPTSGTTGHGAGRSIMSWHCS
jgi:hypothetical protein